MENSTTTPRRPKTQNAMIIEALIGVATFYLWILFVLPFLSFFALQIGFVLAFALAA